LASLFARKHTGDRAFTSLVESQRGPLERYVRGLGASHEDAEEIASAALLRAYLNAPPTLEDPDGQRAWLRTVARNLWIDRTRRLRLKLVTEEASIAEQASHAPAADAGRLVETADEARAVLAAMALLAPSQRAMLYLREVRGLSYAEIADELGTTLPAVESTLHRARHSLARTLKGKSRSRGVRAMAMAPLFLVHRWSGRASAAVHAVPQAIAVKVAIPAVVALTAGGLVVTHHVPALSLGGPSHHRAAKTHAAPGRAGHHILAAGRHAGRSHHSAHGAVVSSAARHRIHGHASAGAATATSPAAGPAATTQAVHGPVKATRAHGPGHGQALGHIASTSHGHVHTPPVKTKPVKTRPATGKTTHAAPPAGSKAHTPSGNGQTVKSPKSPPPTSQGPANRTTPSGSSGLKTTPGGNATANGQAAPAASTPSSATGTGNAAPPGQGKKSS
jgi:RNA polymerase sigma-70 factor (ECF subfamily)